MKVTFDPIADTVRICLDEAPVAEAWEVRKGIVLNFDGANRVVGFEIANAQETLPEAQFRQMLFEVASRY